MPRSPKKATRKTSRKATRKTSQYILEEDLFINVDGWKIGTDNGKLTDGYITLKNEKEFYSYIIADNFTIEDIFDESVDNHYIVISSWNNRDECGTKSIIINCTHTIIEFREGDMVFIRRPLPKKVINKLYTLILDKYKDIIIKKIEE